MAKSFTLSIFLFLTFFSAIGAQTPYSELPYDELMHLTFPVNEKDIDRYATWRGFEQAGKEVGEIALYVEDSLTEHGLSAMLSQAEALLRNDQNLILGIILKKNGFEQIRFNTAYVPLSGIVASNPKLLRESRKNLIDYGKRLFLFCEGADLGSLSELIDFVSQEHKSAQGKPLIMASIKPKFDIPVYTKPFYPIQRPSLLNEILSLWSQNAKAPSFILFEKYHPSFTFYINRLKKVKTFRGNILSEDKQYDFLWRGTIWAKNLQDKFSFPLYDKNIVFLKLQRRGMIIDPDTIIFSESAVPQNLNITVRKSTLNDGLNLHIPFEGKKCFKTFKGRLNFVSIGEHQDKDRGTVAYFDGIESEVRLTKAKDLGLYDQSFTVSFWVNMKVFSDDYENIVNTSTNRYLRGLHLALRERRPYFGFYDNDTQSSTRLNPNEWYNLSWRYSHNDKTQSIFINGKLDCVGRNRHPFHGVGEVNIGYRPPFSNYNDSTSHFKGYIDDLSIWGRALTDEEILEVYQGDKLTVEYENPYLKYILLCLCLGTLSGLLFYAFRKRKLPVASRPKAPMTVDETSELESPVSRKYKINMFGKFSISNVEGEDYSKSFSPKLRSLFMLIAVHTIRHNGISSEDLSKKLWPGLSDDKASNNRRVNIRKLKLALAENEGPELIKNNDRWTIGPLEELDFDFRLLDNLLFEPKLSETDLTQLLEVLGHGAFPPSIKDDWFMDFRVETLQRIFDKLTPFVAEADLSTDLRLTICERLLQFNALSENIHYEKIRILHTLGRTVERDKAFRAVKREYKVRKGEGLELSLDDILSRSENIENADALA